MNLDRYRKQIEEQRNKKPTSLFEEEEKALTTAPPPRRNFAPKDTGDLELVGRGVMSGSYGMASGVSGAIKAIGDVTGIETLSGVG